jgi:hypothetical protein
MPQCEHPTDRSLHDPNGERRTGRTRSNTAPAAGSCLGGLTWAHAAGPAARAPPRPSGSAPCPGWGARLQAGRHEAEVDELEGHPDLPVGHQRRAQVLPQLGLHAARVPLRKPPCTPRVCNRGFASEIK